MLELAAAGWLRESFGAMLTALDVRFSFSPGLGAAETFAHTQRESALFEAPKQTDQTIAENAASLWVSLAGSNSREEEKWRKLLCAPY